MSAPEDPVLRAPGLFENYYIARQNLGLDSCVVVGARFVSAGSHEGTDVTLTKERVYSSLVYALKTHAALSLKAVRITYHDPGEGNGKRTKAGKEVYGFERLQSVNLENVVRFIGNSASNTQGFDAERDEDADVAAILQSEFTRPFPGLPVPGSDTEKVDRDGDIDKPLWRLTVTSSNIILFAWHHCIGDGQSGLVVLRSIFEGLDSTTTPVSLDSVFDPHNVKIPQGLKFTQPLEHLTNLSVSLRTLFSTIVGMLVPPSWTSARKTWTGNSVRSQGGTFSTRVRLISVPPERAKRILGEAKKRGATLTGVLYSLGVAVLLSLVKQREGRDVDKDRYSKISVSVPVSLRPLANVALTTMGIYISTYITDTPILSGFNPTSQVDGGIWTPAAKLSQDLRASLALPKTREIVGLLKYLRGDPSAYESFWKGKLGKKRNGSLEISNLGSFKVPESKDGAAWTITDTYFAQDDGTCGAALKINVVGSSSGSINVTVTWGQDSVEDEFGEGFVKELGNAIEMLVDKELQRDSAE